jgi:hypothetical protein
MKSKAKSKTAKSVHPSGQHIVVVDRGFVYVGDIAVDDQYCTINNARNIRLWGTTKGLGELRNGPTPKTQLDECGTVIVPSKAIISYIKCQGF